MDKSGPDAKRKNFSEFFVSPKSAPSFGITATVNSIVPTPAILYLLQLQLHILLDYKKIKIG